MNHDGAVYDAGLAIELHEPVLNGALCNAIGPWFNVAQITHMALLIIWTTVRLAKWIVMGTCACATIAEISFFMNVEPMQAWGQVVDFVGDHASVRINLLKGDLAVTSLHGFRTAKAWLALRAYFANGLDRVRSHDSWP
eukprot:CAMPEP_0178408482 /NCGR_PEP_ID=MMETSP0689_2-20121128/19965_1 /TAXON_ID=160604 /ORGANISM="Amphidinium massartii, Strain CS-259" /LENGTH=138 /DNA_ID=CAMNT_0020029585 /DNA_START=125 /DNA_END=541 /DNA_ORIENTATION=+